MKERSSVASYLEDFQNHGEECAYIQRRGYRTERWSYRQVAETAFRFAADLKVRQIVLGDRVMLWGENCAEWVAAFLGCAIRGVIVVPMDNGATAEFVDRVLQRVDAKLVVCSRENAGKLSSSPGLTQRLLNLEDLGQALAHYPEKGSDSGNVGRDQILEIVFTSGTTADPKGVVITHGNVLANVMPLEQRILPYLKYERFVHPIRFLNLLPLSHVFGQFLGMFLPPLMGGTVIFQDELNPTDIVRTIRRESVSILVSVPRVLQSLKQKVECDLEEQGQVESFQKRFRVAEGKPFLQRWWMFRRLRGQFGWKFWACICGGASLDSSTEEFWGRLGYAVIQGYGLTETTSLISVNHPFKLGKGSVGKVIPGREVKIAADGEILVRGAGVSSSYWGDSGQMTNGDGWYGTGDIGTFDEGGNLLFKGRKKEVIVTPAGMNIYPEDLEGALRRQPEVKDCVVVGIERGGNAEACAVVILRDDSPIDAVVERANRTLAAYQRMRISVRWPEKDFPRTSTQKPRRNLILERVKAQLNNTIAGATEASSPLAELIARVTGRNMPALRPGATLNSDLGLSSLDRVELMSALEDRYQVDLSETSFSSAHTVADLEQMLSGKSVARAEYHYPAWVLQWPVTWVRFLAHYLLLRPAIILLGWPRIEGREHLKGQTGPFLVIANHIGDVDVGFILTALPGRWRHRLATAAGGEALEALRTPPAGTKLFRRIFDRMEWTLGVSLLNLFPLPRAAGFRQSFSYAGRAVDRGFSVLVFPEGRHTVDGKLNLFRTGIGLLAKNLAVPVLPIKILGLFEVKQKGRKFARPWQIRVRIGAPVRFEENADPEWIARELQKTVEAL